MNHPRHKPCFVGVLCVCAIQAAHTFGQEPEPSEFIPMSPVGSSSRAAGQTQAGEDLSAFPRSSSIPEAPSTASVPRSEREDYLEQEAEPPRRKDGEWEFTLAPYVWAMSLNAQADIGPISATSEACFSELVQKLDAAAQMRFEGLRNRWGFYLDGTYVSLGEDARAKVGPFRIRGIDVDAEFTQAWLDFGGMYRFGERGRSFDLMLGGRYTYLAADVSVGPFADLDESTDYLSPVIGGRVIYELTDKWLVSVKGDAGGFGVGNAADLVLGATALLGYRLSERTTLGFGYRYYDVSFSSGRLDLDLQLHGPLVGVAFRF